MASDSDNNSPDWLEGLTPEEEPAEFNPESSDDPSWMNDTKGSDDALEASQGVVPDWLENIRQQEKSEEPEQDELPQSGSLSPEDKKDTANWLENIRTQYASDTGQLDGSELPDPVDPSSPDYMERVQTLKEEEQDSPPLAAPEEPFAAIEEQPIADPAEEDPGWGDSSGEDVASSSTPAGIWGDDPNEEPSAEDSSPDWLGGLPSIDSGELVDEAIQQPQGDKAQVPNWLHGMEPEDSADLPEAPGFDQAADQAPEWLAGFGDEPPPVPTPGIADIPSVEDPGLPESPEPTETPSGVLPNWLDNLKFSPDDSRRHLEEGEAFAENYAQEDVSALLFEPDDLQDWLDDEDPDAPIEIKPPPPTAEIAPPTETQVEDIAPAELPSWLQAMRPIEAVTAPDSEESEAPVYTGEKEKEGPLAGLSDVLPAETYVVSHTNKSLPVTGFELSEAQQTYTKILKTMVDTETTSPPVQRRKMALPQKMLRWVISFLMMTAVFIGSWESSDTFTLPPAGIPDEETAIYYQIEAISPNSEVLVAFDYQPGFSGEMESAAFAVIDHLLHKNASLSLISTQPTGPDMATRFLNSKMSHHPAVSGLQYANLGFIAGGAAGLRNFAANPRMAITPMNALGQNLWTQPPLNTIQNIRSYSLILVITDDPDVARSWVEQVQPYLDPNAAGTGTPLLMVVSAQAEPLVYPFYQSNPKQVSGIVSGVVGGAYYEVTYTGVTGRPGSANNYWFAYNIAILIAIALIGGISFINLFGVIFRSGKKPKQRGSA